VHYWLLSWLYWSAHDTAAFEHTYTFKNPEYLFQGNEFAWADSANITPLMIPIHCKPAALCPENILFDRIVSQIQVCSEHCMGALKASFSVSMEAESILIQLMIIHKLVVV